MKKKKEAGKRAKDSREVVLDLIFTAFQQHEYYNFKDLVQKTQQPVVSGYTTIQFLPITSLLPPPVISERNSKRSV